LGQGTRCSETLHRGLQALVPGRDAQLLPCELSERAVQGRPHLPTCQVSRVTDPRAQGPVSVAGRSERYLEVGGQRIDPCDAAVSGPFRAPRRSRDSDPDDGALADRREGKVTPLELPPRRYFRPRCGVV